MSQKSARTGILLCLLLAGVSFSAAAQTRKLQLVYNGASGPSFYHWVASQGNGPLLAAIPKLAVEAPGHRVQYLVRYDPHTGKEVGRESLGSDESAWIRQSSDRAIICREGDSGIAVRVEDRNGRRQFTRTDVCGMSYSPIGVYLEENDLEGGGPGSRIRVFDSLGNTLTTLDSAWFVDIDQMRTLPGDSIMVAELCEDESRSALLVLDRRGRTLLRRRYPAGIAVAASPRADILAVSSGGAVDVFDVTGRKIAHRDFLKGTIVIPAIEFSPDGRTIAVSLPRSPHPAITTPDFDTVPSLMRIWDIQRDSILAVSEFNGAAGVNNMTNMAFTADGRGILLLSGRHYLRLIDVSGAEQDAQELSVDFVRQLRETEFLGDFVVLRGDQRTLCYTVRPRE